MRVYVRGELQRPQSALGPLMRESVAADVIGVSVDELRKWRAAGLGPRYTMVAGQVRYSVPLVNEWLGRDAGPDGWKGGVE